MDPRRNIELKARPADWDSVLDRAQQLASDDLGLMRQRDVYFHVLDAASRLKLRVIQYDDGRVDAELVWYQRARQAEAKASLYRRVPCPDWQGLEAALTAALGVRQIVVKARRVFLAGSVRVHLDDVERLGRFVELEAVLGPGDAESQGHARVAQLMRDLGIERHELLADSYGDMDEGVVTP